MKEKTWQRRPHFRGVHQYDPNLLYFRDWPPVNKGFLADFRAWLKDSSYGASAVSIYSAAVRQAIGILKKPYWQIDPEADIQAAWEYLQSRPITPNTQHDYHKGLLKLAEYLRLRLHKPRPERSPNWAHYTASLPDWLAQIVREYVNHRQRSWKPEDRCDAATRCLSTLTHSLRWMAVGNRLERLADLTPALWLEYVDVRLQAGINPKSLNSELAAVQLFLRFQQELAQPVCQRMLLVEPMKQGKPLPRDAPLEQLCRLYHTIQAEARSEHAGKRRCGCMDLAWFLLMLHSGLRTIEIRHLRFTDIQWHERRIRIEQSKGLKDRIVFMSEASIAALQAYMELRGPQEYLPEQVFVYRHQPLSKTYCMERLQTYGKRCGVRITPHQLRHSCATLLLNAGAPVLTVQTILGHKRLDTTLGYARLYDGTVAADYYQAMLSIERRLALPEDRLKPPPTVGQLVAMMDALRRGTLSAQQIETLMLLRSGILALAELQEAIQDVKVPAPLD
jgi:site-specific recombinase XerD